MPSTDLPHVLTLRQQYIGFKNSKNLGTHLGMLEQCNEMLKKVWIALNAARDSGFIVSLYGLDYKCLVMQDLLVALRFVKFMTLFLKKLSFLSTSSLGTLNFCSGGEAEVAALWLAPQSFYAVEVIQ